MTPEQFNIQLQSISDQLYNDIAGLVQSGQVDKRELANILAAGGFDELVAELPIEQLVAQYVDELDDVVFGKGVAFPAAGLEQTVRDLEQMKQIRFDNYFRKINVNAGFFKQALIDSLFQENGNEVILDKLHSLPLNDAQINTIVSTGQADFARTATALAYEDTPEQRFKYIGSINLKTGAEECNWLLMNQKKEGYTKAEIDKGIVCGNPPFIYTSGQNKGQVKKVYWNGRKPNFNCDDEWAPLD